MRSRFLAILLTVAVALAVGVCPCGRALMVGRLAGALLPAGYVNGSAIPGHCPSCSGCGEKPSRPNPNAPDPRLCAATVSGDMPSVSVDVPAADVTLAVFQPLTLLPPLDRALADHDSLFRPGLPPPLTLLNLACCLNT